MNMETNDTIEAAPAAPSTTQNETLNESVALMSIVDVTAPIDSPTANGVVVDAPKAKRIRRKPAATKAASKDADDDDEVTEFGKQFVAQPSEQVEIVSQTEVIPEEDSTGKPSKPAKKSKISKAAKAPKAPKTTKGAKAAKAPKGGKGSKGAKAKVSKARADKPSTGQSADEFQLPYGNLNPKEKKVIDFLDGTGHGLREVKTLEQIAEECFHGKSESKHVTSSGKRANSWARNSLRDLVPGGFAEKSGRGEYKITEAGRKRRERALAPASGESE